MKPIIHAVLITAVSTALLIVLRTYEVEKQLDVLLPLIAFTLLVSIVILLCYAAKLMSNVATLKSTCNRKIRRKLRYAKA